MYLMCLLIFETPVMKTLHVVDEIFCLVRSRLLERVPSSSPWEEGMRELNLEEKVVKLLQAVCGKVQPGRPAGLEKYQAAPAKLKMIQSKNKTSDSHWSYVEYYHVWQDRGLCRWQILPGSCPKKNIAKKFRCLHCNRFLFSTVYMRSERL